MNMTEVLKNAVAGNAGERLTMAAELAGEYQQRRDEAVATANAAAAMAASVLGIELPAGTPGGLQTSQGIELLRGREPVKTCLAAIAKQDRDAASRLFWGLDAARRSAAIAAFRATNAAATAEEAAAIAAGVLSEPYAAAEQSALYPDSGYAARDAFEEDSKVWFSLAFLLGAVARQDVVPALCRFWAPDLQAIVCNDWGDLEAYFKR
ncbi:MAG: hypothetical protein ACKO0Z_06095 [Betaproteobacteria bacterium]